MTEIQKKQVPGGEVLLYQAPDGSTEIDVKFENDTVWLTSHQMSSLFEVDRTSIVRHVHNVYKTGELPRESTCAKIAQVAKDGRKRILDFYNLDMIISIGYRVNSKRGTQFRIGATQRLRDYLIKGYALNQKRLEVIKLDDLEQVVALIKKNIEYAGLSYQETAGLLQVITQYTYSWILLQKYDEDTLPLPELHQELKAKLTYKEAREVIQEMKKKFLPDAQVSEMFGIERNNEFKSILERIYQKYEDQELYPSIEEKAAYLLFFIVKNHPFADGNKKIGAFLFLWFLAKNNCLYKYDGSKKIDDHTLVALTLLVATADNTQRELIIKLILNFLHK